MRDKAKLNDFRTHFLFIAYIIAGMAMAGILKMEKAIT